VAAKEIAMNLSSNAEALTSTGVHGRRIGKYAGFAWALIFSMMGAAVLHAQFLGEVSGTVTDPSGAIVPGALLTLKNQSSGIMRATNTNGDGYFTFAAVPSGAYEITVTAKGFRTWEESDLQLAQGDKRILNNIVLTVGDATEVIRVEGAAELIPPTSGEKSWIIGSNELQNVTMVGRSADELLKIMPGVAPNNGLNHGAWFNDTIAATNLGAGGAYTANGVQPNSMQLQVDGASIVDQGCNCTHTQVVNIDQIQELKLQTSNYSAEYAKGPVIFTAVGKSGGSEFHGAVYFSARNNALNSEDSYQKSQGVPKADFHNYYPGVAIGGPVLIPGVRFNRKREKLFFFGGFEYYAQTPAGTLIQTFVPTQQMLQGNFSQSSLNALGATNYIGLQNAPAGFPNGQVPVSMFNANMVATAKLFPQPNVDPATHEGHNYVVNLVEPQNSWQGRMRGDYSITDMTKLAITYSMQNELDHNPIVLFGPPSGDYVPYPSDMLGHLTSKIVTANLVHVFSPSLTNELVFSNSRFVNNDSYADENAVTRQTIGVNLQGVFKNGNTQIPDIVGNSQGLPSLQGVPALGHFFGLVKEGASISDNITKVFSIHTAKFGFYWDWIGNLQSSYTPANGSLSFSVANNALSTGNIVADFLLGRLSSYSEAQSSPVTDIHYNTLAFYAQDSWKVNRRLTIEYGIRFDHLTPWKDNSGVGFASWYPALYSNDPSQLGKNPGILWHAINGSVPNSGIPTRAFFYEPRFGLAYDLFGKGKTVVRGGIGEYRFQTSSDSVSAALNLTHANAQFNSPAPLLVTQIDSSVYQPVASKQAVTAMMSGDDEEPLTTTYSFTITQAMPGRSVAEFGYVGNQTTHALRENGLANINNVPVGALFRSDPITGAPANPGTANLDDYRPMTNYQQVTVISHGAYQNYNGLQLSWRKETSRHLISANYTFGKALGLVSGSQGSLIDPFHPDANYGVLAYDHTHLFNIAYSFVLPNLAHNNTFLKAAVNGWQVSGITLMQSGAPIQPNNGGNLNLSGPISNRTWLGTDAVLLRPLLTCDPRSGLAQNQHANPACFSLPTALGIGNNGNLVFPYMKGEPYFNHDLSLFKTFPINETKRVQFRAVANNFLNHPLHSFTDNNAELNLNFNANSQLTNASTFGRALYTTGYRQLYFVARFEF